MFGMPPKMDREAMDMAEESRPYKKQYPPELQSERRRAQEMGDRLYEQYGKPLEAEHWGMYLAVHPNGQYVVDEDREAAHNRALNELGKGYFLFQVGPKATVRWTGIRRVDLHSNGD